LQARQQSIDIAASLAADLMYIRIDADVLVRLVLEYMKNVLHRWRHGLIALFLQNKRPVRPFHMFEITFAFKSHG
jgi:hypothetical protein